MLFRWNVIQMQTLMFVSFAFYSATNIVFADVKDGKKLSIQLIRVGRTEFDGFRGSTSEFLSIFSDIVFVRNNLFLCPVNSGTVCNAADCRYVISFSEKLKAILTGYAVLLGTEFHRFNLYIW